MTNSEQERTRIQIEEYVDRREYDAAFRFAVREADDAYAKQRYAQGIDVLRTFVQMLASRQINIWNLYVATYQKIVGLDNQLRDKPATIRDLVELSRYCIRLGDFDKALSAANSAVSIDGQSTEALNQKARVLAYRRDYNQAFKALESSLAIAPHDPRTLYLKGTILGNNGRFPDALAVYEEVRRTDPSYPGLGKAIAEMRRQIDWKVKAVEGPATGQRTSQSSELESIPAIQRKARSAEPEMSTRSTLETLYDEAVIGEPLLGPAAGTGLIGAMTDGSETEAASFTQYMPSTSDESPQVAAEEPVVAPVQTSSEEAVAPHQAWDAQAIAQPAAEMRHMPSEAEGLTILSPGKVRPAAEPGVPEPATAAWKSGGTDLESRLIELLRGMLQEDVDRQELTGRLSGCDDLSISLTLGVLYFDFLRHPQDDRAMTDLLAWLVHNGYRRLPLYVVEEAIAQGAPVDLADPQVAETVLSADSADMPPELRARRAELLLERGDTGAYVREELGMLRQKGMSVSSEGLVRQLSQILEHAATDTDGVEAVLAAASDLGVTDQLVDRMTLDPSLARIPALEAAIVNRLGHTGVDETTFLNNEALFQRVTLGSEKSTILRRILVNAASQTTRRKILQSLLILGTPTTEEYTELVELMVPEQETASAPYLIQYLVDHQKEVTNGRELLGRLSRLVPADYDSRCGLGLAAQQLDVLDVAAGCFIQAISARPADTEAVAHALQSILAAGAYDRIADVAGSSQLAAADLEGMVDKAVEAQGIDPSSADQRLLSVWSAYAGGRYEETVAMSSPAVRGGGDMRYYIPMALAFVRLGFPELASREFDRAIRNPDIPDDVRLALKYHAGVIQLGQGNVEQAAQLLREVREASPDFREVDELIAACEKQGSRIA